MSPLNAPRLRRAAAVLLLHGTFFAMTARAAESVAIAAAADLSYCLDDINAAFKKAQS